MKRIVFGILVLGLVQYVCAAGDAENKKARAFPTKDASVNMAEVKKNPVFADRYTKLESAYKEILMRLQQEERSIQQDVKAGKLTEAQVYGKSQEFEFEFRNAQKTLQEGVMALEEKVNDVIVKILKAEGWDGCQVQMFGYVNPDRDITAHVVKALEEKLKAEEAAEKFKKAPAKEETTPATKAEPKVEGKPGVRPAPERKKAATKTVA